MLPVALVSLVLADTNVLGSREAQPTHKEVVWYPFSLVGRHNLLDEVAYSTPWPLHSRDLSSDGGCRAQRLSQTSVTWNHVIRVGCQVSLPIIGDCLSRVFKN